MKIKLLRPLFGRQRGDVMEVEHRLGSGLCRLGDADPAPEPDAHVQVDAALSMNNAILRAVQAVNANFPVLPPVPRPVMQIDARKTDPAEVEARVRAALKRNKKKQHRRR